MWQAANLFRPAATAGRVIYLFDDIQELEACCSCFVSADGVRTISTINDLVSHAAFVGAKTSVGAIKVVGSERGCGIIPGRFFSAAFLGPNNLAEGLGASLGHTETIASNLPPSFGFVTSTSVDEFANAPIDNAEVSSLTFFCTALFFGGSGAGICTCGSGENVPVLP